MKSSNKRKYLNLLPTVLAAASALLYLGSNAYSASPGSGPLLRAADRLTAPRPGSMTAAVLSVSATVPAMMPPAISAVVSAVVPVGERPEVAAGAERAISALASSVKPLSHPNALEDAFESYFAFKAVHASEVHNPYFYFVDYGLPATTARGYVFDMSTLRIVDGPFMVAHGRGSAPNAKGVPTRFSNSFGAATTSLGLYVAQNLYAFTGHAGGQHYSSVGLRLAGVSGAFNSNALARGVVAHGAPYVTPNRAGRSEGCPAMETSRAQRLLPKLANGGLVFLFAPDSNWMSRDPWLAAG